MVGRPSGRIRLKTAKTQSRQIQRFDERLNDAHRVLLQNVLIDTLGKQISLVTVGPLNEPAHSSPSHSRDDAILSSFNEFSHSLGR